LVSSSAVADLTTGLAVFAFILSVTPAVIEVADAGFMTLIGLPASVSPVDYRAAEVVDCDCKPAPTPAFMGPLPIGRPSCCSLNGCFFGNVSARCMISRIYSDESIFAVELADMLKWDEAIVDCFLASLLNSSTACPTTLFILYELTGRF